MDDRTELLNHTTNIDRTEILDSQGTFYARGENNRPQDIPPDALPPEITNIQPMTDKGGFSVLFKAWKSDLGIPVVIKRSRLEFHGRVSDESEARILTQLRHTYLPRVYALRTASDGLTYMVMDYIEGTTLRAFIQRYGRINQKLTYKWTQQLCEVISYMHSGAPASIIHSDLKPENIMITPQGNICVIDFNASLEVIDPSRALAAIGATPGYAAPEQFNYPPENFSPDNPLYPFVMHAQGYGPVTYRTDIYAIGALAYYMLTAHDPAPWFRPLVPMEDYHAVVGDAFYAFIMKAMQPVPKDRYASADEMLKVLRRLPRLSRAYRRRVRRIWILYFVLLAGFLSSILCVREGLISLGEEHAAHYEALVAEADSLRDEGNLNDALTILRQAVSYDDTRTEAYAELGALLYQRGDYEEGVQLLENVQFPDDGTMEAPGENIGRIYYILGACYYGLEEYDNALKAYQQAVFFNADDVAAQRDLAIAYARTGDMDAANDTIRTLESLHCPEADLAMVRGEIEFASEDYESAFEDLVTAAKGAKEQADKSRSYLQAAKAADALGSSWLDQKISMLEEARSDLDETHSVQVLQMLAQSYIDKAQTEGTAAEDAARDYEKALGCLDQVEQLGISTLTTRLNHALCLQYLERFDEARQELDTLEEEYPDDYRIPMRKAFICLQQEAAKDVSSRDYSDFRKEYEKAQQLYQNTNSQDPEMMHLESLAEDVEAKGW